MTLKGNPFDLSGRVAVVTGGNGGLGLAMAEAMAGLGCAVAIWGRNAEKNGAALSRLEKNGSPVAAIECDVAKADQIETAFSQTMEQFGRVDGMFANAGLSGSVKSFLDRTPKEWADLMAVNLDGVIRCFQVAGRHMVEHAKQGDPYGRLVATSSVAALDGAAFNEHYGTSKGAVNALVRAIAVEVARHGITANAILPGYAVTEMTEGLMANDKFVNNVLPRIPMRRFGQASDYAGIASYLMSDLSSYHTGQSFVIDGGYSIY